MKQVLVVAVAALFFVPVAHAEIVNINQCLNGAPNEGTGICTCNVGYVNDSNGGCVASQGSPLPGGGPGSSTPGGGIESGGSGGTTEPPCDAACQEAKRVKAKQDCRKAAAEKFEGCKGNAKAFLTHCIMSWAGGYAVDQCTATRGLGLGVDGGERPRIVGPILDCELIEPGQGHDSFSICHPRIDARGRIDYYDPMIDDSAWATGGCLSGRCNGSQGGTVGSGTSTTGGSRTFEIRPPWGDFFTVGGTSIRNDSHSTEEIVVQAHDGLYATCSKEHLKEKGACEKVEALDRGKCDRM